MNNDSSDVYEIETKAANRIGRRLRRLLGGAGRGGGRGGGIGKRIGDEPFDPNAYDGDGDGLVQDGTAFERPAVASAQVLQALPITRQAPAGSDEAVRETVTGDPTGNPTIPERSDGTPKVAGEGDTSLVVPTSAPALSKAEQRRKDYLKREKAQKRLPSGRKNDERGSLEGLTNKEIAERLVPATEKEVYEAARDTAVGNPSRYPTRAHYDEAVKTHKTVYDYETRVRKAQLEALRKVYDAEFGRGALDKDSREQPLLYEKRFIELFGSGVAFAQERVNRRGQNAYHGWLLDETKFIEFMNWLKNETVDQNGNPKPNAKPELVALALFVGDQMRDWLNANGHQKLFMAFWGGQFLTQSPAFDFARVSPFEFMLANLLLDKNNPIYKGIDADQRANTRHDFGNGERAAAELLLNTFFDWIADNHTYIDRDGKVNGLPTRNQLLARLNYIQEAKYTQAALGMLLPRPLRQPVIDNTGAVLGSFEVVNTSHTAKTFDPEDVATFRVIVEQALANNPAFRDAVIQAGSMPMGRQHPALLRNPASPLIVGADLITNKNNVREGRLQRAWNRLKEAALLRKKGLIPDASAPNGYRKRTYNEVVSTPMEQIGLGDSGGWAGQASMFDGHITFNPTSVDLHFFEGSDIDNETVNPTKPFTTHAGVDSLIIHEWSHGFNMALAMDITNELRRIKDEMELDLIAQGVSPTDAAKQSNDWFIAQLERGGLTYSAIRDGRMSGGAKPLTIDASWGFIVDRANNTKLRGKNFTSRDALPKGRGVIDWENPQKYGFDTREELLTVLMGTLADWQDKRALHDERRQIAVDHKNRIALSEQAVRRGVISQADHEQNVEQFEKDLSKKIKDIHTKAVDSDEPYVASEYGNSIMVERFPETLAGVLHKRTAEDGPFYVNNAATRWVARLFLWLRRDGTNDGAVNSNGARHIAVDDGNGGTIVVGDKTARRFRRKKRPADPNDPYEDITEKVLSTEVIQSPSQARKLDGKPEDLSVSSRTPQEARGVLATRFDPDARSVLTSGRSNIGLDTDARLYAFDEPITQQDSRLRSRVHSVGDYRFYDNTIRYGESLTPSLRTTLGYLAGKRYINRNNPHHGDMVRMLSATTFGLFIDDMPTYDTTTGRDREILRGLVTGEISALPQELRMVIERAVKDAAYIHHAIVHAPLTKRDLYRSINTDPERFVSGLVVGERIPMPITAFSHRTPSVDDVVVLRVLAGAKALDVGDGSLLTQGEFEVVAVDRDDTGRVVATVRHAGVYDPRHDAMRPTDRFSEPPGAHWRKMGSHQARYTPDETEMMIVDKARREDRDEAARLTSGRTRLSEVQRSEQLIRDLIGATSEERKATYDQVKGKKKREAIEQVKGKLIDFVRTTVLKRLSRVENILTDMYGDETPWISDADAMRLVKSIPGHQIAEMGKRMHSRLSQTQYSGGADNLHLIKQPKTQQEYDDLQRQMRLAARSFMSNMGMFSKFQLRGMLEDKRLYIHPVDDKDSSSYAARTMGRSFDDFKNTAIGYIDLSQGTDDAPGMDEDEEVFISKLFGFVEVLEKAYNIDKRINLPDGAVAFVPSNGLNGAVTVSYVPFYPTSPERKFAFDISGRIFASRDKNEVRKALDAARAWSGEGDQSTWTSVTSGTPFVGKFARRLIISPDETELHNNTMGVNKDAPAGIATLINQHAFLWMRNVNAQLRLTVAMDGPLVWARHGFGPSTLEKTVLIRTADAIERALDGLLTGIEPLEIDYSDEDSDFAPFDPMDLLGFGGKTLQELNEEELDFAIRLAGWAALVRSGKVIGENGMVRPAGALTSLIVLANLLPGEKQQTTLQKELWKRLFEHLVTVGTNQYDLDLGRPDLDDDFLPSFIVRDPKNEKLVEIQIKTTRPLDDTVGPSRDFFLGQGYGPQNPEQVSRLIDAFGQYSGNLKSLNTTTESMGFTGVPHLVTPQELEEQLKDIDARPIAGIADVSITTDTRLDTDADVEGRLRSLLFGEHTTAGRGIMFTDSPILHAHEMQIGRRRIAATGIEPDEPNDPATTKAGVIGVFKPWKRIIDTTAIAAVGRGVVDALTIAMDKSARDYIKSPRMEDDPFFDVEELSGIRGRLIAFVNTPEMTDIDSDDKQDVRRVIYAITGMLDELINALEGDGSGVYTPNGRVAKTQRALKNFLQIFLSRDGFDSRSGMGESFTNGSRSGSNTTDHMLLAAILGYDAISAKTKGSQKERSKDYVVLNRGALILADERVSLQDMARITGGQRPGFTGAEAFAELAKQKLRNIFIADDWWKSEDPSLLAIHNQTDPSPIDVSPRQIETQAFMRQVRQDFGVNLPTERSKRLSSGRNARKRYARMGFPQEPDPFDGFRVVGWYEPEENTPLREAHLSGDFSAIIASAKRREELMEQIEKLEEQVMDISDKAWDEDWAGKTWDTVTRTARNKVKGQIIDLEEQIDTLKDEVDDITDRFVRDIKTINYMLAQALHRQGLINAIDKLVRENDGDGGYVRLDKGPLPDELMQRLMALREKLIEQQQAEPLKYNLEDIARDARVYAEILEDNWDLRWDLIHPERHRLSEDDGILDYENEDGDYKLKDWLEEHEDAWLMYLTKNLYRRATPKMHRSIIDITDTRRDFDKAERDLLTDELWTILGEITDAQRDLWRRFTERQFEEDYQRSRANAGQDDGPFIPDEVLTTHSPPSGISHSQWRKIRAVGKLAKKSPYEGERKASVEAAKRLLTAAGREDLANDDYIAKLPSGRRSSMAPDVVLRADLSRGPVPSRGRDPRDTSGKDFIQQVIEGMGARGHTITEADLAVDSPLMRLLHFTGWGENHTYVMRMPMGDLDTLIRMTPNEWEKRKRQSADAQVLMTSMRRRDPQTVAHIDRQPTEEDEQLIRDLTEVLVSVATQEVQAIPQPGHKIKKWQGPIASVGDVLADDTDIDLIKAQGAPSFDTLMTLYAHTLAERRRLNLAFGADRESGRSLGARVLFTSEGSDYSAYYASINEQPVHEVRNGKHYVVYKDRLGREILRAPIQKERGQTLKQDIEESNAKPLAPHLIMPITELLHELHRAGAHTKALDASPLPIPSDLNTVTVNDTVFEAMCDALGIEHPGLALLRKDEQASPSDGLSTRAWETRDAPERVAGRASDGTPIRYAPQEEQFGSLTKLKMVRERYAYFLQELEFADTYAGTHVKRLFENRLRFLDQQIDIMETLGKRHAETIRQRVAGRYTKEIEPGDPRIIDYVQRGFDVMRALNGGNRGTAYSYLSDSPTSANLGGVSVAEQAVHAHIRQEIIAGGLPMYTDFTVDGDNLHEIGHFAFGQAFTRHGEHMANMWAFFLYGPHMWGPAMENEAVQKQFKQMTVYQHFNKKVDASGDPLAGAIEKGGVVRSDGQLDGFNEPLTPLEAEYLMERNELSNSNVKEALRVLLGKIDTLDLPQDEKQELRDQVLKDFAENTLMMGLGKPTFEIGQESGKWNDEDARRHKELEEQFGEGAARGAFIRGSSATDRTIPLPAHLYGWPRDSREGDKLASGRRLRSGRDENELVEEGFPTTSTGFYDTDFETGAPVDKRVLNGGIKKARKKTVLAVEHSDEFRDFTYPSPFDSEFITDEFLEISRHQDESHERVFVDANTQSNNDAALAVATWSGQALFVKTIERGFQRFIGTHHAINKFLRTGELIDDKTRKGLEELDISEGQYEAAVLKMIATLDDTIDQFDIPQDVIVFRGISTAASDGISARGIGATMVDRGYQSTSTSEAVVRDSFIGDGHRRMLRIHLKAGQRALAIPTRTNAEGENFDMFGGKFGITMNEEEILLPRGLTMRVIGIEQNSAKDYPLEIIDVEIVEDELDAQIEVGKKTRRITDPIGTAEPITRGAQEGTGVASKMMQTVLREDSLDGVIKAILIDYNFYGREPKEARRKLRQSGASDAPPLELDRYTSSLDHHEDAKFGRYESAMNADIVDYGGTSLVSVLKHLWLSGYSSSRHPDNYPDEEIAKSMDGLDIETIKNVLVRDNTANTAKDLPWNRMTFTQRIRWTRALIARTKVSPSLTQKEKDIVIDLLEKQVERQRRNRDQFFKLQLHTSIVERQRRSWRKALDGVPLSEDAQYRADMLDREGRGLYGRSSYGIGGSDYRTTPPYGAEDMQTDGPDGWSDYIDKRAIVDIEMLMDYMNTRFESWNAWGRESAEEGKVREWGTMPLDRIFTKLTPLDRPHTVFRGISVDAMQKVIEIGEGGIYVDHGYISASSLESDAMFFATTGSSTYEMQELMKLKQRPLLVIKLPKGQKAVFIPTPDQDKEIGGIENAEVLLPRGTKFKVAKITKLSNDRPEATPYYQVELEVVGNEVPGFETGGKQRLSSGRRGHPLDYEELQRVDPTGENLDLLPTYPDPLAAEINEDRQTDGDIFPNTEIGWRVYNNQDPWYKFPRYVARFEKLLKHYNSYLQGGPGSKQVDEKYKKLWSLMGPGGYARSGYVNINRLLRLGPEGFASALIQQEIDEARARYKRGQWDSALKRMVYELPEGWQPREGLVEREFAEASKQIAHIDSIIKDSPPLEEPITVFRGITSWKVMQMIDEAGVGGIITEKGYMSTSVSPVPLTARYVDYGGEQPPQESKWATWDMFSASRRGDGGWHDRLRAMPMLKIFVPAGARGTTTTALKPDDGDGHDWRFDSIQVIEEAELLLPRDTKLRILSIDDGYVTAEVVLDDDASSSAKLASGRDIMKVYEDYQAGRLPQQGESNIFTELVERQRPYRETLAEKKEVLENWRSGKFYKAQHILRGGSLWDKDTEAEEQMELVPVLDKIIADAPKTDKPIVVFKGIRDNRTMQRILKLGVGGEYLDVAFAATSVSPEKASSFKFRENRLVKILVPAGTSALAVPLTELFGDDALGRELQKATEQEILLPRNSKFKIVEIDDDYITVELLDQEEPAPTATLLSGRRLPSGRRWQDELLSQRRLGNELPIDKVDRRIIDFEKGTSRLLDATEGWDKPGWYADPITPEVIREHAKLGASSYVDLAKIQHPYKQNLDYDAQNALWQWKSGALSWVQRILRSRTPKDIQTEEVIVSADDDPYADLRARYDSKVVINPDVVDVLDRAIADAPKSDKPMMVFRGVTDASFMLRILKLGVGGEFQDKGFIATSTSLGSQSYFSDSRPDPDSVRTDYVDRIRQYPLMRILIPAGMGGLITSQSKDTRNLQALLNGVNGEQEILLPRNAQFRILEINSAFITVEMLGTEEKSSRLTSGRRLASGRLPMQERFAKRVPQLDTRTRDLAQQGVESKVFLWDKMSPGARARFIGGVEQELTRRLAELTRYEESIQASIDRQMYAYPDREPKVLLAKLDRAQRGIEAVRLAESALRTLEVRDDPNHETKVVVLRDRLGKLLGFTMYNISNDEKDIQFDSRESEAVAAAPLGRQIFVDYHISLQVLKGVGDALFAQMLMNERERNVQAVILEYTMWSLDYWEGMGFMPLDLSEDEGYSMAEYLKLVAPTDRMVVGLKPIPSASQSTELTD